MITISILEKVAIGLLCAMYLIPPFVPLVKIWTGEPHLDTGPSYPILAAMSVALFVLWPCCLVASVIAKERRWYYVGATLFFAVYLVALTPLFRIGS